MTMKGNLEALRAALQSPDAAERARAAERIAASSKPWPELAVPLTIAAGDSNDAVRMWAADALEASGPPTTDDLPRLMAILRNPPDSESAYWSATLIGRLGPKAAPAVETLAEALQRSPYLPVRERAAWALGRLGPAALQAASQLRRAARDASPRLSRLANAALRAADRHAA